jgi:iron uptake system EfeUOB component EfeO/EfeM
MRTVPLLLLVLLTGCSDGGSTPDTDDGSYVVAVDVDDTKCVVTQTSIPAGPTTFVIKNTGKKDATFALRRGKTVVISTPLVDDGATVRLSSTLIAGAYEADCNGTKTAITVTGSASPTS